MKKIELARKELKELIVQLGETTPGVASFQVDRLDDEEVKTMLPHKRARRAHQLEVEAITQRNHAAEQEEPDLLLDNFDFENPVGHVMRGGRRIIRKGSEMGG